MSDGQFQISENLSVACDILEEGGMHSVASAIRSGAVAGSAFAIQRSDGMYRMRKSYRWTADPTKARLFSSIGTAKGQLTLAIKHNRRYRRKDIPDATFKIVAMATLPVGEVPLDG